MGGSVDDALDFLSEKLFPFVEAYSRIRLSLYQQMEAQLQSSNPGGKDKASEISYRDFLFDSMVQATTKRLALDFSQILKGKAINLNAELCICISLHNALAFYLLGTGILSSTQNPTSASASASSLLIGL